MAVVVEGLTVRTERAERAAAGLLLATDVADYLVGKGMPFRRAHELVGAMTRRLLAENRDFESLLAASGLDVVSLTNLRMPTFVPTIVPLVVGTAVRAAESTRPM